ncbi:MAG: FtsX-like permease family protein [Vicinamibacterales bacterium]
MKPDDIDDELRFHVDSRVSELMAEGWSRANAVSRAEAELGDRAAVQASCQQIARAAGQAHSRRRYWIGVVQDLRYASRSLQRSASFSVATIAVLALGIGLTTAVVAALYGIIYSPLPYPDSENLHQVYAVNTAKDLHESPMSAADFYALRDRLPGEVRRIRTSADTGWRTVVGVVRDVHHGGLNTAEGPAIYIPHAQKAEAWMTWMSMAVHSPMTKAAAVRAAIASGDRNQPVSDVMTLSQLVSDALALPRLAAAVAAAVSLIALLLAAFGTGAVLSRLIAARIPEFGLRLALGANPARLAWTPVWEVVRLVGAGSLAGLLVAAGSSRLLAGLLHDVSPFDGPTYAVALAVIVMTGVAAAIGPAMRVARIAPVIALRE